MDVPGLPFSHASIELAKNPSGTVIGVRISALILTKDVKDLAEPLKKAAEGRLYDEATRGVR